MSLRQLLRGRTAINGFDGEWPRSCAERGLIPLDVPVYQSLYSGFAVARERHAARAAGCRSDATKQSEVPKPAPNERRPPSTATMTDDGNGSCSSQPAARRSPPVARKKKTRTGPASSGRVSSRCTSRGSRTHREHGFAGERQPIAVRTPGNQRCSLGCGPSSAYGRTTPGATLVRPPPRNGRR